MSEINCPVCDAATDIDAETCTGCGADLILGRLVSHGTGVIPNRFTWMLKPGRYTIGRGVGNTFIIPSSGVPGTAAKLHYDRDEKAFVIQPTTTKGVFVNGVPLTGRRQLKHGDMLRIVIEQFEFQTAKPRVAMPAAGAAAPAAPVSKTPSGMTPLAAAPSADESVYTVASNLQKTLAYIDEFYNTEDFNKLAEKVVDAVVEVTRTRRGFLFMLNREDSGEVALQEVTSRAAGGTPLKNKAYDISQSFMQKVLEGAGMVVVQDAVRENVMTATMLKHQLRALVCLPITVTNPETEDVQTVGIIYADNFLPTEKLPPDCGTTLRMFAQAISTKLQQCWKEQAKDQLISTYQESFSQFAGLLNGICEQGAILRQTAMADDARLTLENLLASAEAAKQQLAALAE